jgi:3-oxoacyl-[acyl-carrier protein] reductase
MRLSGKNAVIYGGGGSIGGAVARAFAREGAAVHLVGRTRETLERVADDVRCGGGVAEVAVLDALDEAAVDAHAEAVASRAGSLDISLNVTNHNDVQGTPLVDMSLADFEAPVHTAVRTMFLTARAAARHMIRQRSGVILVFGGYGPPMRDWNLGGLQVAFGAQEYLRRNLAAELGPYGVRTVTLQTAGVPDSIPADAVARGEIEEMITRQTLLGRAATLDDVGRVAAFAASDDARTITGSAINITCGTTVD